VARISATHAARLIRLEHREHDPAPVRGAVLRADRVGDRLLGAAEILAERARVGDVERTRPQAGTEEGGVDHRRFAGAFPVEERGRHAVADHERGHPIAEAGPAVDRFVAVRRQRVEDAGPAEEHRGVEAGFAAIRSLRSQRVDAHVDDLGVSRADMVDIDLQPLAHIGQQVREEDVARLGQPVENVSTRRGGKVDAHAALPAVGVLDHRAVRARGDDAADDERADRIAAPGMLDLDDIRAEVGEQNARRGHHDPCPDLEHAHPVQHGGNAISL
jgi:hypothetical protein